MRRLSVILLIVFFAGFISLTSDEKPHLFTSEVTITTDSLFRYINANGIPKHETGDFPNKNNPNSISPQDFSLAMGAVGQEVIERNEGHWNGDHCMYAGHVPGVLLSTKPLGVTEASLIDFAPTVLDYFGITPPEGMKGQLLFAPAKEK